MTVHTLYPHTTSVHCTLYPLRAPLIVPRLSVTYESECGAVAWSIWYVLALHGVLLRRKIVSGQRNKIPPWIRSLSSYAGSGGRSAWRLSPNPQQFGETVQSKALMSGFFKRITVFFGAIKGSFGKPWHAWHLTVLHQSLVISLLHIQDLSLLQ